MLARLSVCDLINSFSLTADDSQLSTFFQIYLKSYYMQFLFSRVTTLN